MDTVRILRVLEYEGPRLWLEKTLLARGVKGSYVFPNKAIIREAILGEFPTILVKKGKETNK